MPSSTARSPRIVVEVGERGEHQERSTRRRLERVVRACAGASQNESQFVARLREHGLHRGGELFAAPSR